jgi:hypothetical protein
MSKKNKIGKIDVSKAIENIEKRSYQQPRKIVESFKPLPENNLEDIKKIFKEKEKEISEIEKTEFEIKERKIRCPGWLKVLIILLFVAFLIFGFVLAYGIFSGSFKSISNQTCPSINIPSCPSVPSCPVAPACNCSLSCGTTNYTIINNITVSPTVYTNSSG